MSLKNSVYVLKNSTITKMHIKVARAGKDKRGKGRHNCNEIEEGRDGGMGGGSGCGCQQALVKKKNTTVAMV